MSHHNNSTRNKNKASLWVAIGAIILIVLLLLWQGIALFSGDTDVSGGNGFTEEFIAPMMNIVSGIF